MSLLVNFVFNKENNTPLHCILLHYQTLIQIHGLPIQQPNETTGAPKLWIYDDTVLAYGPVNPGPAALVGPCIGNESQHLITLARHIHGSNSPFINTLACPLIFRAGDMFFFSVMTC